MTSWGANPVVRTAKSEEIEKMNLLSRKIMALLRAEGQDPSISLNALLMSASTVVIALADPNHDEKAFEAFRQMMKSMRIVTKTTPH